MLLFLTMKKLAILTINLKIVNLNLINYFFENKIDDNSGFENYKRIEAKLLLNDLKVLH